MKKVYLSAEWDLVEIEKSAQVIVKETGFKYKSPEFMKIIRTPEMIQINYKGSLVNALHTKIIEEKQIFGCRIQIVASDPADNLYCIDDRQFALDDKVSLHNLMYGEFEDPIYIKEDGVKTRFNGFYELSERISQPYTDAGWKEHSVKIKVNCLTHLITKNKKQVDYFKKMVNQWNHHLRNESFFDITHCVNAA